MASFSSTSTSNPCTPKWKYDMFLSFCPSDSSCKAFASRLYTALRSARVNVFRDDNEERRISGDQKPPPSVLGAIRESQIAIVVFSRNYGGSNWCFQELEEIMVAKIDASMSSSDKVIPVFFEVDPSDVRLLKGTFGEAFQDLIQRNKVKEDEMRRWRAALSKASSISGSASVESRYDSEDINKIVECVTDLLGRTDLFVAEHPVGVESRVQDVIRLLKTHESKDTVRLQIRGKDGIGKTTIAKAVYNQIGGDFEAKCFLLNVSYCCQLNGIISLQEKLLSDIDKTCKIKIDTVASGIAELKRRLSQKTIFLVLDDVSGTNQLEALCGSREWFGQGSRIIITTEDREIVHKEVGVECVYKMTEMDEVESLELFSWHAFKKPSPDEDWAGLSEEVVRNCGGLPLLLQLIGSFRGTLKLSSAVGRLQQIPDYEVMEKFLTIYALSDDYIKDIFCDIACYFIGMDQYDVLEILKDHNKQFAETGISELAERCLVTIDRKNRIQMHDVLREMGGEKRRKSNIGQMNKIYEVFLSFRGEDTRAKLVSHLYASLKNAGNHVFRDDDEIQRGDMISVSLLRAIGKSKICIVVLSKNYANSKWCMLELMEIMINQIAADLVVVPVFYEVDPSDIRNQTGEFGKAFENLITRLPADEVKAEIWRETLRLVGSIAGVLVFNSRNESEDIDRIVEYVTDLLDKTVLFVAKHPVGVESRVQDVIRLLNNHESKDTLLLGIRGMGGLGKTTIAKAVYNQIGRKFEAKCFLPNVRTCCEQSNGIVSLQQKLLSDIYKTCKIKIDTVASGIAELERRLSQKTIFLVLDDVSELDQLQALCGSREWFGQGSRIIITTRDEEIVHKKVGVECVYRIEGMDKMESLELFSWHAFKKPSLDEGFANLSRDVVEYCGGLPLALQVIGSYLLTRESKTVWRSVLEKLKVIPDDKVVEKLRISYDGLSDDYIKDIFLDIAFFFIGMDRYDVTQILKDHEHFPEIGISELERQSLVTFDRKNRIEMHDLLRDMGREIVRKQSNGGKEPSRLWRYEDMHCVLSRDTRRMDVQGLSLKSPEIDTAHSLDETAFAKMDKLRLLQLAGVQFDGDFKYLSRELRWISWHRFPLKYTPTNFYQESLVAIDFRYSNLQQVWKKSQLMKNLKFLNLSHSTNLTQTPDFANLPNLEKLVLKNCNALSSVSHTIGYLSKILLINLKNCTSLHELPRSMYKLKSLKTLILSGCSNIDKLEEDIEQMVSLTTLVADRTGIKRVPFAIVRSKSIGYISLCGHEGFSRDVFPSIIQSWMTPTNNVFSLLQTYSAGMEEQNSSSSEGRLDALKDLPELPCLWVKCDSEIHLNQSVERILDALTTTNFQVSNNNSSLIDGHSQVCISGSKNSLTSLLIQMGMNCSIANTLRERISQEMFSIGSGSLPGDNYPDWLTFSSESSSVTFEVPQVDGRNLKTIMCIVYSSSPDKNITSGGLKNMLLINCTKNTIQLYKNDAFDSLDVEEWQKEVSNIEPGNKVEVVVVFEDGFILKKTTVYLIYDDDPIEEKAEHYHEQDVNVAVSGDDENRFGRFFSILPSLVRAVLTSKPFWFGLTGFLIGSRYFSNQQRSCKPILREISSERTQESNNQVVRNATPSADVHEDVKRWDEEKEPTITLWMG